MKVLFLFHYLIPKKKYFSQYFGSKKKKVKVYYGHDFELK